MDAVAPAIASFTRTRMVDCGADIGLTGQLLASHVKDLKSVTAFVNPMLMSMTFSKPISPL